MIAEKIFHGRDRRAGALDDRMTIARIGNRRRQHVGRTHRSVVAQQQHPGVEHSRHAGREQPGARHDIEAELGEARDGRRGGRRPLPADHLRLAALHVVQNDRNVAARSVEMRLDHLQHEGRRNRRIESVAAFLERGHADRRRDPVRCGDDAEGAFDLGPRRERIGIYL